MRHIDVTDREDVARAAASVAKALGGNGLFAVLNNAGINYAAPFEFADEAHAQAVLDVNGMGPFRVTQAFLPLLIRHNDVHSTKSRVINIASWAGVVGQPFIPFYNASKFGLSGMTESVFYDLGLLGVHVVLALPGVTKTPFLGKTTATGLANLDSMPAEDRARYAPLMKHYAAIGEKYGNSTFFLTADKVAERLVRIVDRSRPAFRYTLAPDACLIDRFLSRFLPWSLQARMNRQMFRLSAA